MNNPGNEYEMVNANNYVRDDQLARKKWHPIKSVPAVIFAKVGAAIMLNRKRLVTRPFLIDNNSMAYIFDDSWDINFGKIYLKQSIYQDMHKSVLCQAIMDQISRALKFFYPGKMNNLKLESLL